MKQYTRIYISSVIILTSCIGLLNYYIDPYGIWQTQCSEMLNCRKTQAGNKIYLTKANQWKNYEFSGLILGNSRTELGINPSDISGTNISYYNLSIRGAALPTTLTYLQNVVKLKQIKHVILGIDFFSFRERPELPSEWPPKAPEFLPFDAFGEPVGKYYFKNITSSFTSLFSLESTSDSLLTVINQNRHVSYLEPDGFEQSLMFNEMINAEGAKAIFSHDLNSLEKKFKGVEYTLYGANGLSRSFESLLAIIELAKNKKINLDIIINPLHISYFQKLKETGHFHIYLLWKDVLVKKLEDNKFFSKFNLYDFSIIDEISVEPIPEEKGLPMNYWYEAAHYKPTVGKIITNSVIHKDTEYLVTYSNLQQRLKEESEFAKKYY